AAPPRLAPGPAPADDLAALAAVVTAH
ncbi:MAG: hypothetical protein JWP53_2941, partial [Conexibacter sp.]|nr:hypothetical protein [Conexibacter sp.]